jgi:hypothetical protein
MGHKRDAVKQFEVLAVLKLVLSRTRAIVKLDPASVLSKNTPARKI